MDWWRPFVSTQSIRKLDRIETDLISEIAHWYYQEWKTPQQRTAQRSKDVSQMYLSTFTAQRLTRSGTGILQGTQHRGDAKGQGWINRLNQSFLCERQQFLYQLQIERLQNRLAFAPLAE